MNDINIGNTKISLLKKSDIRKFLKRTIVIYGSSNSGKTVLLKDILFSLKDDFPNYIIVSPTNKMNKTFSKIAHEQFIYDSVNEESFNKILDRQIINVNIYDTYTCNIEGQINLLKKYFTQNDYRQLESYKKIYNIELNKINQRSNIDMTLINELKNKMKKIYNKQIKNFIESKFKTYAKNIIHDNEHNNITIKEYNLFKYHKINPNFLLILDDCGSTARGKNGWCKYNSISRLFMEGRHYHITFIITCQDDIQLERQFRDNAHITIFTTQNSTTKFFEKDPSYRKKTKKINNICSSIFESNDFKKLIYFKDDKNHFSYYSASIIDNFKLGSLQLRELCEKLKKSDNISSNNQFSKFYK